MWSVMHAVIYLLCKEVPKKSVSTNNEYLSKYATSPRKFISFWIVAGTDQPLIALTASKSENTLLFLTKYSNCDNLLAVNTHFLGLVHDLLLSHSVRT